MSVASQNASVSKMTAELGRRAEGTSPRFGNWLKHGLIASLVVAGVCSSMLAFRSYRNYQTESRLLELGAQYQWAKVDIGERRSRSMRALHLVPLLCDMFEISRADFSSVSLSRGNLEDEQLEFLSQLRALESLTLESNRATDRTLDIISQLPDLRYLSLAGNRFSVLGLLQLRNAANLEQLEIDISTLTPIELAVLKSELPGVSLRDSVQPRDAGVRKLSIAAEPAA